MPSSVLSHKTGKGSPVNPFSDLLFLLSYPVANCELLHKIREITQYLQRKHLVNSERMAQLSTGQRKILPYGPTPFLLGWRTAERKRVSGDWGWRLRAMVVLVGGEVYGERHALCSFDWGKYDTLLPSLFDLPEFNFHSLQALSLPPLVIDGRFD